MDISPRVSRAYVGVLDCRADMDGSLMVLLRGMGMVPAVFGHPADLAQAFSRGQFDMLLLVPNVGGTGATDLLDELKMHLEPGIPVLLLLEEGIVASCLPFLSRPRHDFVLMPYHAAEVKGRIQLLLEKRRGQEELSLRSMEFGAYHFEPTTRTVSLHGTSLRLTHKEFSLAFFLFQHPGRIWKRDALQFLAWGQNEVDTSRTLDTHISRLRSRLQLHPANGFELVSVYREGYKLDAVAPWALEVQRVIAEQATVPTGVGA